MRYWWMCFFFFFKQKTAYEMRISDWSSDVCSSDLIALLDGDVLALGDQVLARLLVLRLRHHDNAALGLVVLAELHAAGDLADNRVVLRLAGLEQLRHPRQAAGDVARLGGFPRNQIGRAACRERVWQYV